MTTREKIIVGLMLLTVVYGVYTVFFEGKGNTKPKEISAFSSTEQLESLNAFITKVVDATKLGLTDEDKYIIKQAEAEWKQDPLISVELKDRPESEWKPDPDKIVPIPDLKISYTGFMQMGDKKFAIINGVEYTSGDKLEQGDYIVRSITPRQVIIVSTGRSKKKFIFPLEE